MMKYKGIFLFIGLLLCSLDAGAQKLTAQSSSIDVGQVEYFHPVTASFDIKNTGKKALYINKVETGCNCTVADYPTGALAAGATGSIRITYDARMMGHFDKVIEVYSNASAAPLNLMMSGVVVEEIDDYAGSYPFALGSLSADKNVVNFGDVHLGEVVEQSFHIYNPTSKTVTPQVMHLPSYLKASLSPSSIAPNRSAVVTLSLDTRFMHDYGYERTTLYLGANPGEKVSAEKQLIVGMTLLPTAQTLTEAEAAIAPRIVLSADSVTFSAEKGKKSVTIEMKNIGRSRLSIYNISVSSEGVQLSLNKRALSPNETAKLKITPDLKRLKSLQVSAEPSSLELSQAQQTLYKTVVSPPEIILITNDPEHPKVTISVTPYPM